jgi:Zn-dependent alcohol dehydrogenase
MQESKVMVVKAAVCREFGQPLVIEEIALAEPRTGEVRVAVKACAICHSDVMYADGAWGGDLPAVYGHEAAGVVESVGEGVGNVRPGDHVIVTLIRNCGHCHYCARGSHVLCEEVFPLDRQSPVADASGAPVTHGLRTGAFAEKVVVHSSQVIAVDRDIPFDIASLLACGVITGYGAVTNTAGVRPGESVAVIGCGGVGLNAIQGAAIAGAETVIAIDLADDKLAAALGLGATHAVNVNQGDARQSVLDMTCGRGVDYVFVTVGAKPAFDSAFGYITKNGCIVIVGMPPSGVTSSYDPETVASWNQKIIGSKMGETRIDRDIPALIGLYRGGRLKLDELITARYPLAGINDAIAATRNGEAIRNVIRFD